MTSYFLDTSGIYAWTVRNDPFHERIVSLVTSGQARFVVTDYVLDEAFTLLLARGIGHRRRALLNLVRESRVIQLHFVGEDRFWEAAKWMIRFSDQSFSFTDCTSFVVMQELGLKEALTTDSDFEVAGFNYLLMNP